MLKSEPTGEGPDEKTEAANQTPAKQTPAAGVSPAVVATTSSAVGPTEWTVAGWLGSTGGAIDALAYSLSSGRAPEQSELEFVRGLGTKGTRAQSQSQFY